MAGRINRCPRTFATLAMSEPRSTTRSIALRRAVLNVSRESMARYGFSPATRVFEAAGAGACLITDEWEGIPMFLEPGREVLVARDGDEVADTLQHLSPERAQAISGTLQLNACYPNTLIHTAVNKWTRSSPADSPP